MSEGVNTPLRQISSSQVYEYINDLEPAGYYNVEVTAHNSAGSTTASYQISTLTTDGCKSICLNSIYIE